MELIICIIEGALLIALFIAMMKARKDKENYEKQLIAQDRSFQCFITMKKWMDAKLEGKSFDSYFAAYNYQTIALYGAGEMGKLLWKDIRKTGIDVKYFVDKNADGITTIDGIPIIKPEDIAKQPRVDALIITPLGDYNEISKVLIRIAPELATVSIQDAVYEL